MVEFFKKMFYLLKFMTSELKWRILCLSKADAIFISLKSAGKIRGQKKFRGLALNKLKRILNFNVRFRKVFFWQEKLKLGFF